MIQEILGLWSSYEQYHELLNRPALSAALRAAIEHPPLILVLFSCLATEKGREELVWDFFKTAFFDGGRKEMSAAARRAYRLVEETSGRGLGIEVWPILVDTEPRRTWGWQTAQADLTAACELMVDDALTSKKLPANWHPMIWSAIEKQYTGLDSFEQCLASARQPNSHWTRRAEQERHLRAFAHRYHFPLGLSETAVRQVAAYAFEGVVLQQLSPPAILLQSENPAREKDPLYQWRRPRDPLPIIHPFKLR